LLRPASATNHLPDRCFLWGQNRYKLPDWNRREAAHNLMAVVPQPVTSLISSVRPSDSFDPLRSTQLVSCNTHWCEASSQLPATDTWYLLLLCHGRTHAEMSTVNMWRSDVYHLLPMCHVQISRNKVLDIRVLATLLF